MSEPQNTYYLHLQVKNNNRNPIELQYRQAGSDDSWQQIIIPALNHQWFYLPFNRIENFPMSVQFRICDQVNHRHLTIANHGGMFLWQPTSRYSTEQLTVGNTSIIYFHSTSFELISFRDGCIFKNSECTTVFPSWHKTSKQLPTNFHFHNIRLMLDELWDNVLCEQDYL